MNIVTVGNYKVGQGCPMLLMAGPCVLEGYERSLMIGQRAKAIADKLGMPYVFKINSACPMFLRHLSIKQTVLPIILSAGRD